MISIKYFGTGLDYSGYGCANRMDINALYCAGVNVSTEIIRQVPERVNYGLAEAITLGLVDRPIPYKIKILHVTPDVYEANMEKGVYHIGRLFWEVEGLPKGWVEACNKMNELWVASDQMAEMLRRAGVKIPMYRFSQPIDTTRGYEKIMPYSVPFSRDFTFYSIFQWINRKNARGLLEAYWKQFEGNEKVVLIIKTYRLMYTSSEYAFIKNDIDEWKKKVGLKNYPRVFLVNKLMTDGEMARFHATGDCYVSASSGEGWNRPAHEAMLFDKPVISGDVGGITDYLTDQYFKVSSKTSDIKPDNWHTYYQPPQTWKELDIEDLQLQMKTVYNDVVAAKKVATKAKDFVVNNFSYQIVGSQMRNRLETIEKGL